MPRLIIADDHPFTLLGTRAFVEQLGYVVAGVYDNGISAFNAIRVDAPGIAILDVDMPGMNGIEILDALSTERSPTRVVLLTMHNEISIFNHARKLGAAGYLLKEFATGELQRCLAAIENGGTWFSPGLSGHLVVDKNPAMSDDALSMFTFSERKILDLIARQQTSRQIAATLFVSEKTVESHRRNIMQKLGLPQEKNALLLWAVKNLTP